MTKKMYMELLDIDKRKSTCHFFFKIWLANKNTIKKEEKFNGTFKDIF